MMKKKITAALCTMALLFSGTMIHNPVLANEVTHPIEVINQFADKDVIELDLQTVRSLATSNSRNLAILELSKELLELQKEQTKDSMERKPFEIPIPPQCSDVSMFSASSGDGDAGGASGEKNDNNAIDQALQDQLGDLVFQQCMLTTVLDGLLNSQNEAMKSQLESALKNIEEQLERNPIQKEELEEAIRLMVTGQFLEVQGLQEALELQEKAFEISRLEEVRQQRLLELGLLPKNEIEKIERELSKQYEDLQTTKKQYELALEKLLIDLNFDTDKKVVIKPIELDNLGTVSKNPDIDDLVARSYTIKLLNKDLAKVVQERVDASGNESEIKQKEVKMKEHEIHEKKNELKKKVLQLYTDADKAYVTMKQAERDAAYELKQYERLEIQYDLGLISRNDYIKASLGYEQQLMNLKQAQMNYYMYMQQVFAANRGFIS